MPKVIALTRRDARENRNAILRAAREVFAEQGFHAPLEAIAIRASVSRTTLHRNFKNREDLGVAIFERNLALMHERANALKLEPGGFLVLLEQVIDGIATDAGLADVIGWQHPSENNKMMELRRRAIGIMLPLWQRAQKEGLIRKKFDIDELFLLLDALRGAVVGISDMQERRSRLTRIMQLVYVGILQPDK